MNVLNSKPQINLKNHISNKNKGESIRYCPKITVPNTLALSAGRTPALRFRLTALFSSSRFPENWYADKIHLPLCTIQFASTFFILSDRGLHFVASTDSKKSPASFPFGLPAGDFHFSAEAPSVHRPQGRKPTLQLQPTKVCFQVFRGLFPAQ